MNQSNPQSDPQKKYWWLILVVVPILVALIAILPKFLEKGGTFGKQESTTPDIEQRAENVKQTTERGSTFTNVQGDITIETISPGEDKKKQ